jgi:hypothetical protein
MKYFHEMLKKRRLPEDGPGANIPSMRTGIVRSVILREKIDVSDSARYQRSARRPRGAARGACCTLAGQ